MSYEEEIDLLRNEIFEFRKGEDTRIVISELMARIDVQADRIAELEAQVAADEGELEIARRLIRDLQGKKDETALMAAIDDLMKQVKDLKEIAIGERAGFLHYRASCHDPARRCPYAKGCDDCTGWDTCSALDRFNADAIRQLSEEHPEAFR
jgi:uncharacterized coiled-coil protein SlyX